jgi:hypothetical protein
VSTSILLQIDDPADRVIRAPACVIRGWLACSDRSAAPEVQFYIGRVQLRWKPEPRPDVSEAHPDKASVGFRIDFELKEHLYALEGGMVTITLALQGAPQMQLEFSLVNGVIGSCLLAAAGV